MRRASALLVLAALAGPASAAETLLVRAGEHADFSRLAIDLPSAGTWTIASEGRSARIIFPQSSLSFDTRQIYPERRLSRVLRANGSTNDRGSEMRLSLNCDCKLEAYRDASQTLVIDVRSSPSATSLAQKPGWSASQVFAPDSSLGGDRDIEESDLSSLSAARTEELLRDRLHSAAMQGLVRFDEKSSDGRTSSRSPDGSDGALRESQPQAGSTDAGFDPNAINDRAATSGAPKQERGETNPALPNCPPEEWLDMARWSDGAPSIKGVRELRRNLRTASGRRDPRVALELAKRYVALGFGAEATAVLANADALSEEAGLVADIARIVDGQVIRRDGALAQSNPCGARISLWRAVASVRHDGPSAALAGALEELPVGLRLLVAPRLIESLVAGNHVEDARRALLVSQRATRHRQTDLALSEASLMLAEGDADGAQAVLESLLDERSEAGARAATELSRIARQGGGEPSAVVRRRTAAAAFELRGSELGERSRHAEISDLAAAGELLVALSELERDANAKHGDPAEHARLLHDVFSIADANAIEPVAYATATLRFIDLAPDDPDFDAARLVVARGASSIGLPNLALRVLEPTVSRGSSDAAFAAAQARIAGGDGQAAIALLGGRRGGDANALRARALALLGMHEDAFESLPAEPHDSVDRAAFAWRAGAWSAAARLTTDPARAELASLMAEQRRSADARGGGTPSIGRSEAALRGSRETRRLLGKAMADG